MMHTKKWNLQEFSPPKSVQCLSWDLFCVLGPFFHSMAAWHGGQSDQISLQLHQYKLQIYQTWKHKKIQLRMLTPQVKQWIYWNTFAHLEHWLCSVFKTIIFSKKNFFRWNNEKGRRKLQHQMLKRRSSNRSNGNLIMCSQACEDCI